MKRIYAAAVIAVSGTDAVGAVAIVRAVSDAEAFGLAISHCRAVYPAADGYRSHDATVKQVPDEWIAQAAKETTP